MDASSLIEAVRRHLGGGEAPEPGALRRALVARPTDRRKRRGIRHELAPVVSVLAAGAACGYRGPLAIAEAAAGWDQELLAAHGCRVSPATGLRVAPSARTLYRVPEGLDADELEAALTAALADAALDPQVTAAAPAQAAEGAGEEGEEAEAEAAGGGELPPGAGGRLVPAAPAAPVAGSRGHGGSGARPGPARGGRGRQGAQGRKAGGNNKVHLLAAVTHTPGIVITQDKVAKSGKANEMSHFRPLLAPLPLDGTVVTSDAMQANRDNALFLRKVKKAHYLWPALGNQPTLSETLTGLPWEDTPVAAATSEITRGRIETRTLRVLPCPGGTGFEGAEQALLIERYVTYKKKGRWHTRAEAILYLTSLAEDETTPEDLLAHVRGHWRVEHAHWLRDVIWKEDKSLIRTGNAPQVWSAIANLIISLFRIRGVTSYTAETRRCAPDPGRALQILDLTALSPG